MIETFKIEQQHGKTLVVPGIDGKRVRVCGVSIVVEGGATRLQWYAAKGDQATDKLTGQIPVSPGVIDREYLEIPLVVGPEGHGLILASLAEGVALNGRIAVAYVDAVDA